MNICKWELDRGKYKTDYTFPTLFNKCHFSDSDFGPLFMVYDAKNADIN